MAAIGTPILGDDKYGGDRLVPPVLTNRLHLHARRLVLPLGKRNLVLEAPLPDHMRRTWATLGWAEQDVPEDPFAEVP